MQTIHSRAPSVRFHTSVISAARGAPARPASARGPSRTNSASSAWSVRRTLSDSSVGSLQPLRRHAAALLPCCRAQRSTAEQQPGLPSLLSPDPPPRLRTSALHSGSARHRRRSLSFRSSRRSQQWKPKGSLSVGRRKPEDAWPPGTNWPQVLPQDSPLPSQAGFLGESSKHLLREASLRPGLFVVYRGPRVRAMGADRGMQTFSVWNGATCLHTALRDSADAADTRKV